MVSLKSIPVQHVFMYLGSGNREYESKMRSVLLAMLRQWVRMKVVARSQGVRMGEIQMSSIQNTAPGMTRVYNKRTQVTMRGGKCYELGKKIRSTTPVV